MYLVTIENWGFLWMTSLLHSKPPSSPQRACCSWNKFQTPTRVPCLPLGVSISTLAPRALGPLALPSLTHTSRLLLPPRLCPGFLCLAHCPQTTHGCLILIWDSAQMPSVQRPFLNSFRKQHLSSSVILDHSYSHYLLFFSHRVSAVLLPTIFLIPRIEYTALGTW